MIRRLLEWSLSLGWYVHLIAVLAYMAAIFVLSSSNVNPFTEMGFFEVALVNLCHVPIYFGLAVVVGLFVRRLAAGGGARGEEDRGPAAARAVAAAMIVLLFGASDEFHQSFTGRIPSLLDVGADLIGGVLGVLALGYFLDNRPAAKVFWPSAAALAVLAAAIVVVGSR